MKRFIITEDEKKHISNLYEQSVKRDTKEGVEAENTGWISVDDFIKQYKGKNGTWSVKSDDHVTLFIEESPGRLSGPISLTK